MPVFLVACFLFFLLALPACAAVPEAYGREIRIHNSPHPFLIYMYGYDSDRHSLTFELVDPPQNGTYSVHPGPDLQGYLVGNATLVYTPAPGYSGSQDIRYRARDSEGVYSEVAVLSLTVLPPVPDPWVPPVGIAKPEFGIEESYRMYDEPARRNDELSYAQNAEGGYYTHFIDNTHDQASDSVNEFGTPTRPRLTIPRFLPAGSVVELHGGPYRYASQGHSRDMFFSSQGTVRHPVFVRSGNTSVQTVMGVLRVAGSYLIVEHFHFAGPERAGISTRAPSHHIGIRYCRASGLISADQPNTFGLAPAGNDDIDFNDYIVFYANRHHDNGYPVSSSEYLFNDYQISGNSRGIWIVDSRMEYGSEDAIHVITFADCRFMPDGVFIGRNVMHHHAENAIDVKQSRNVVISQNFMYGYRAITIPPNDGSDGAAICFNYESGAPVGQTIENHYLIFNRIYDSERGVRSEYNSNIYGNLFYDINNADGRTGAAAVVAGIVFDNYNEYINVFNNTIHNAWRGVLHWKGTNLFVYNNLIAEVGDAHIQYQTVTNAVRELPHNLLWNPDASAVLKVGGSGARYYQGLANFPAASNTVNCLESNPRLVSLEPSHPMYMNLSSTSPAINAGSGSGRVQQMFGDFHEVFGISIQQDLAGTHCPQGGGWDIGAYEYLPGGSSNQSISLNTGWNWISFNVLPFDFTLNHFWADIMGNVEQVRTQTQSAMRVGSSWIGDLADMEAIAQGRMYIVRVSANCTLTASGTPIPDNAQIPLHSGWNWVAYYPAGPQPITPALASITGPAQQARSQTQSAIYSTGSWLGDLGQMVPGQGYTIQMNGSGALAYPRE